ncbi:unnamed protein product [Medioppia subpectinata]|uniref:Uncharacterized protein n=1 Tax=Medioppia subpectinata TaxID=1979941 RepID=A0A7R9KKR8_9ACAR|nr:unnamed protein product [Medioppia subpectinata]CAG2105055.1 unnamed protein product [Medioppia subpectinata]
MPATRSRTSTEGADASAETDKKVDDIIESSTDAVDAATAVDPEEVKEAVEKESNSESSDSTSVDSKPVENSENGSNDELKSDANGDNKNGDNNVENGSNKRKSTGGEEGGDAPDSTDITPKKAKLDAEAVADETNGSNNGKAAQQEETPAAVETTA